MIVSEFLRKQGYHPATPMPELETWREWYQGEVKSFHSYTQYNGSKIVSRTRASMQMAKQVSEDWASLILNEKVTITTDQERITNLIQGVLGYNSFHLRANQLIELMMALGTAGFVEYFDNLGRIAIDYVRADMILPIRWENGEIIDCAFYSSIHIEGKEHFYINVHTLDTKSPTGPEYVITNYLIDAIKGKEQPLPEGLAPEVRTGRDLPRFQIITPNLVNNVDFDSPFGISVYANSIPKLEKVDLIFDSGNNEFALGKKRIFIPLSMAQREIAGVPGTSPIFDTNDVAFYALPQMNATDQMPKDLTGELRIDAHSRGLQDALNYLSDSVGLGSGRYEYTRPSGAKTATEVISEDSKLYQTLQKHELIISQALQNLCQTIVYMAGLDMEIDFTISFDDSIIEDPAQKRAQALLEYNAGLIDEVSYFVHVYGITEDEAIERVRKTMERRQSLQPQTSERTIQDSTELEMDEDYEMPEA